MENNKSISLALIISALGIILIAALAWVGMLISGMALVEASVIAGVVLLVGIAASLLAVKALGASAGFKKWRRVEYASLAAMVAVIVFSAHWAVIGVNYVFMSDDIRREAHRELQASGELIDNFQSVRKRQLESTVGGLRNFLSYGATTTDPSLTAFVNSEVLSGTANARLSEPVINSFKSEKSGIIERGSTSVDLIGSFRHDSRLLGVIIDNLYPYELAQLPDTLRAFRSETELFLSTLGGTLNLPQIKSVGGEFRMLAPEQIATPGVSESQFYTLMENIKEPQGRSVGVFAVLVFLFLFDYIISPRGLRKALDKGPRKSDNYGILI